MLRDVVGRLVTGNYFSLCSDLPMKALLAIQLLLVPFVKTHNVDGRRHIAATGMEVVLETVLLIY